MQSFPVSVYFFEATCEIMDFKPVALRNLQPVFDC